MIAIIDTETTGISKPNMNALLAPGICQLAIVRLDFDLNEISSMSFLVNPEQAAGHWEKSAIETHGIKPGDVEDAPTFFEAFPVIANFVLGATVWSGWNTEYDQRVIATQLERYGFERSFPWPPATLDMMQIAIRVMEMKGKKGMKFPKLGEAYTHFIGGELKDAHDALADCRAVGDIMRKIGGPYVRPLLERTPAPAWAK